MSLSIDTWVTCNGLVGVEMVGRRGEPTRPLTKDEKPVFVFLRASGRASLESFWSPERRLWSSDLGAVMASIFLPRAVKLADCLSRGDLCVLRLASALGERPGELLREAGVELMWSMLR